MNFKAQKDNKFQNHSFLLKEDNIISDSTYLEFMSDFGDGYYFNQSLHLYGNSNDLKYHDFVSRTNFIKKEYYWIKGIDNINCFGEDLFGNQFVFYPLGIGMLILESGEIEFISTDFKGWLSKIKEDLDYYSGQSLLIEWNKVNSRLEYNERLTPKKPFILGGDYLIDNIYKSDFSKIISFNSDLAKQIYDLPDGTSINIKID